MTHDNARLVNKLKKAPSRSARSSCVDHRDFTQAKSSALGFNWLSRVSSFGFRVQGSRFRVWGLGFRVQGSDVKV
jgi:hypothetical protein